MSELLLAALPLICPNSALHGDGAHGHDDDLHHNDDGLYVYDIYLLKEYKSNDISGYKRIQS